MNENVKDELDENVEVETEEEVTEFEDGDDGDDSDVEFDYDDDGNIVIPEDEEDYTDDDPKEDSDDDVEDGVDDEKATKGNDDAKTKQDTKDVDAPKVEPATAPDARDIELARLRKQLEEKDKQISERDSQIRDTLKHLGADENEGVAGLEKLAAEAAEMSLDEYRKQKAERMQTEEAMRIVRNQKFEEKTRADLAAVQAAYPSTKQYKSVFEFPNFDKFSHYRDLGLAPDIAYIAANPQGVMTSVAESVKQQTNNLAGTKDHLRSNVPVGSSDKSVTITKKQLSEYRDLFPNMSDKEIIALHKKTMKK